MIFGMDLERGPGTCLVYTWSTAVAFHLWTDKLDRHSRLEVAPCATVALTGDLDAGPVELLVPL